ncbi:MAG: virulence factor TspB C-terminal domain-related protein [Paludibacter sp.]|nr:virulence factor TspB C-terminal domain-related protein [Paludibacter sp.]
MKLFILYLTFFCALFAFDKCHARTREAAQSLCQSQYSTAGNPNGWSCQDIQTGNIGNPLTQTGNIDIRSNTNINVDYGSPAFSYVGFGCAPPKFYNLFGVCEIPECPTSQVSNINTGACQTPPTCSYTEHYDNATNSCVLNPLSCPTHSHANSTNDACLPDAPLACPNGQHDDGNYHCVADDVAACKKNQQSGYINNVLQCIPRTNKHETNQANANSDKALSDTANDASIANSSDQALANAANARSNNTLTEQGKASNALLDSIDQTTNELNNREKMKQATTGGDSCEQPPSCTGDAILCAMLRQQHQQNCFGTAPNQFDVNRALGGQSTLTEVTTSLSGLDSSGLGLSSTCPVPKHYSVMGADFSLDLMPFCQVAEVIGYCVMITASFISLRMLAA